MNDAQDLNDAVRGDPVDYQMSRSADALLWYHETPRQAEMVRPETRDSRNLARAREGRVLAQGNQCGEDQLVVARGGVDAPLPGTLEEDSIDPILGASDQPERH